MSANLGPAACLRIYLAMLPFAMLGAALMMVVASYSKGFREAQTYTSLAMVVPALPIIVVALNPLQPTLAWMLVRSLSQHLLITGIVKGDAIAPAHAATSAASALLFAALCLLATVRRYRSERLLI